MNYTAVLETVSSQITEGLVGPGTSALGNLANALTVALQDNQRGMMLLRARIGEQRDIVMSISVEIAPGVARVVLFIPSSIANTHGSVIAGAIMHVGDYKKYPATLNDEAFACDIRGGVLDADPEQASQETHKSIAQRLLYEIRTLWLTTVQIMANVGILGRRSAITVFCTEPLLGEMVSARCGGASVGVVQADNSGDDQRLLAFVDAYCDDQTLLRALSSIEGVEIVGSHHPISALV